MIYWAFRLCATNSAIAEELGVSETAVIDRLARLRKQADQYFSREPARCLFYRQSRFDKGIFLTSKTTGSRVPVASLKIKSSSLACTTTV
jgi:hypothetical protein